MGNRVNYVVIDGIPPWDGRYGFDDFSFTNRELYEIKKVCGIRAAELIEALDANDTSAYVAVASVVMVKNGTLVDLDDLWNAKVGSITIELGAVDDADPPTTPAAESEPSLTETSSGGGSSSVGDAPANDPSPTGSRSSETSE